MFTCKASIELHSHRDVSVPSPRMNPDVATSNSWIKRVCHHSVAVSVSSEILQRDKKRFEKLLKRVLKSNFQVHRTVIYYDTIN